MPVIFKDHPNGEDPYLLLIGSQGQAKEGLHKRCPDLQQLLSRVSGANPVLDDLVDIVVDIPACSGSHQTPSFAFADPVGSCLDRMNAAAHM